MSNGTAPETKLGTGRWFSPNGMPLAWVLAACPDYFGDTKKYQGEFPFKDIKPSASNNIVVVKNKSEKAGHPEIVSCYCKLVTINDRKCISKKVRKSGKLLTSVCPISFFLHHFQSLFRIPEIHGICIKEFRIIRVIIFSMPF